MCDPNQSDLHSADDDDYVELPVSIPSDLLDDGPVRVSIRWPDGKGEPIASVVIRTGEDGEPEIVEDYDG